MSSTGSSSQATLRPAVHDEPTTPVTPTSLENSEERHLDGLPLILVMVGLMLCIFLASLDQLILSACPLSARPLITVADLVFQATAMPRIVSQFHSLAEVLFSPGSQLEHGKYNAFLDFMDCKCVFPDDGCIYDRMFFNLASFLRSSWPNVRQGYGQILNLVPIKWAIISSVIIFELGSLFCAVSFNVSVDMSSSYIVDVYSLSDR
jgi:hypothetical protein